MRLSRTLGLLILLLSLPCLAAAQTANTLSVRGAPSGGIPALAATGVDANISINLVPKGTGAVLFGGVAGITGGGGAGFLPLFTAPTVVGNSRLFQDPVTGNIGLGTVTPSTQAPLNIVVNVAGVQRVDFSNTSAGDQRAGYIARADVAQAVLDVAGSGAILAPITGTTAPNMVDLRAITTNAFLIRTSQAAPIIFATNNVDRWHLLTTGHLTATTDNTMDIGAAGATRPRTGYFGTSVITPLVDLPSAGIVSWNTDLFLSRQAAATLQQGGPDAAAPVAQSSGVQNVLAGTLDTAGTGRLLLGSRGTGTGVGGNIGVQVAYPGLTGTAQNPLTTVVTALATNISTNALQDLVSVTPIVNQSGTASYNGFTVDVTRTAVGSGVGQILALKVGGVQRFGVTDGATGVGTHVRAAQATPPTCSANCGTTVPAVVGTDFSMLVTMGSGGVPTSPFTVTFNGTYTTPPSCQVVANVTTTAFVTKVAPTAATVVVTTATNPAINDSYNLMCTGVV